MKTWGAGLIALGAFIALVALVVMPSTVSAEEMTTLPYTGSVIGSGRYTETYNMPRAQFREMVFHGGGFTFLAGILLFVGGTLEALIQSGRVQSADPVGNPGGEASGSAPSVGITPDAVPVEPAVAIYDMDAAQAAAIKNKEMVAWAFAACITVLLLVFLVAQVYGPGTAR